MAKINRFTPCKKPIHRRALLLSMFFLCTIGYLYTTARFEPQDISSQIYNFLNPSKSIYCYHLPTTTNNLPDMSTYKIRKGKSVFFHETSCRSRENGKITILPRQACAVESAARLNPNLDVYLTFSSPGNLKFDEDEQNDRLLQQLQTYPNVRMVYLNFANYTKGTKLESIYSKLKSSSYPQSHASDILRYLTLYKFGGIYLDMDVVVVKSLEDLKPNFAGIETDRNVAAGVLSLDAEGVGHMHAESCVLDLMDNYHNHAWGDNGPGVITRLLRRLCNVHLSKDMVNRGCGNFTVYPAYMFYPIPWEEWKLYFDTERVGHVFERCRDSYVVHVWNKHSESTKVPIGTRTAYTLLAERHCPRVFKQCDTYF